MGVSLIFFYFYYDIVSSGLFRATICFNEIKRQKKGI